MTLNGQTLIMELNENSGLDSDFFDQQMNELLTSYSVNPETLELDQLREILADYLQQLILVEEHSAS